MLTEISAGLSSLKSAHDILKSLNAASTQATLNEIQITLQQRVMDAQQALLAAQEAQSAAAKRIDDLEQQIVQFKNWESEKQRYELKTIGTGAFAYMPKPGMENGEPLHAICQHCYERGVKSVLQSNGKRTWMEHSWDCPNCRTGVKATQRALICPDEE